MSRRSMQPLVAGDSARGLCAVGASAGSGKTHRVTQAVLSAVRPSNSDGNAASPLEVEQLLAVTYTRRAAAELKSRIRQRLIEAEDFEQALRLPLARLGTVHSVCLQLLQEHALSAGLSPSVNVLPDDGGRRLRAALETAVPEGQKERLTVLAGRLELEGPYRAGWVAEVSRVMDLARGNRIAAQQLSRMAERSVEGLLAHVPKPARDGAALDAELDRAIKACLRSLEKADDSTKVTADACSTVRDIQRRRHQGNWKWNDWAKLAELKTSARSRDLAEPLRVAASEYPRHPQLHADLREMILGIYECARLGLEAFSEWKARRGVVDYPDMLDLGLRLLEVPEVADRLREELRLVVVDELQDSSPIQLALFTGLHRLAERSIWVGDRKQCIFEYAGADPQLMDSVLRWTAASGGTTEQLSRSYRSRRELVEFCSELFAGALAPHGYARQEVVLEPHRTEEAAQSKLPPLGVLWLEARNRSAELSALAVGVRDLLEEPTRTPIKDRQTGKVRHLRAGDVAVLVRTNEEATALADGLGELGIHAALARPGLLSTPEGAAVTSALRLVLHETDSLAQATLEALQGFNGRTAEQWLEERLRQIACGSPASAPFAESFRRIRERIRVLAPSEALDAILDALDASELTARWPNPSQRLANLDALRALARDYETHCGQSRKSATLSGLLAWLEECSQETWDGTEERASDEQHFTISDDSVVISTYHRSKGLEWPVVILGSLGKDRDRDAFGVHPESSADHFDPVRPLEGRWIRYWLWPFGNRKSPLRETIEASDVAQRAAERSHLEQLRLLYVGCTRARDHLIFAARPGKGTAWLDRVVDAQGEPLLDLSVAESTKKRATIGVRRSKRRMLEVRARVSWAGAEEHSAERYRPAARWFQRTDAAQAEAARSAPSYWIAPSQAEKDWPELEPLVPTELVRIHDGLTVATRGVDLALFGTALHEFLAADITARELRSEAEPSEVRLARATALLEERGLSGTVEPKDLLRASDALREHVAARWPGARWSCEVPVTAMVSAAEGAARRVRGAVDLLLETAEGLVIVDHKSFLGSEAAVRAKAAEYGGQIGAYARVFPRVRAPATLYLHFPLRGVLLELRPADRPRELQNP